jgi:hypothetical protein
MTQPEDLPLPANDYHFVTRWRVRSTAEEAADVISDATGLPRWWPAVYLDVREVAPGDPSGVGRVLDLYTKGWLPYTLRWRFTVTQSDYPHTLALAAEGDFTGTGVWTFEQDGDFTHVTYDWTIRAEKPLLRHLSWLMKPVFSANHRWAMATGERSLALELERRQLPPGQRARVPAPPSPTPSARQLAVPLAAAGAFLLAGLALRRASR